MTDSPAPRTGPLAGLRVFDLSRILAGPTCTQLLGDLGADVIKIERPGAGDDTRKWGPPYLRGKDGDTNESAYYLASNRNKRSLTIDISRPEGQALAKRLIAERGIGGLVIGLPVNMDGSEGPRCQSVRQFAANLLQRMTLPIAFWDERLTTAAVTRAMLKLDVSRARRAQAVDKMAAAYILQGALDALGRHSAA